MESSRTELPRELALRREAKPISLREIADSTKINICYLEAIESGDFQKLPGGIFSTSYLRQYATAIGFDGAQLLAHYERKMNPPASGSNSRADASGTQSFLDRWLKVPAEAQR